MGKRTRRTHIASLATTALAALALQAAVIEPAAAARATTTPAISAGAYALLAERTTASRAGFAVYRDADSGFNHGFGSGFFANTGKLPDLDAACIDDPQAANGCSADPERLDRTRGTVLRISFSALSFGEYAGVNIEEPEHWSERRNGRGYDLRGADRVVFDVRSPDNARVQFGVHEHTAEYRELPQSWTTLSVPLASLGLSAADLADVHVLFSVATNDLHARNGATVLLDNIRFEPVPVQQLAAVGFPLGNETFGVIPRTEAAPGRVPIPPDQILRNLTTIYESAITLQAFLTRGIEADRANARLIAEALHYALQHENTGMPLPPAPDGSHGLHNAYMNGDLAFFNDQTGAGEGGVRGAVRLAGFTAGVALCQETQFCLVLDGATGGNNAFAILALAAAYKDTGDAHYLDDAAAIARWIVGNLLDTTNTGYGGYFIGYPDQGATPKVLLKGKSTENNADIFAALTELARIETALGNDAPAAEWAAHAKIAGDFVMGMFDAESGCFFAGTLPGGAAAQPGTAAAGTQQDDEVIDTGDFLDSNTFATLALASAPAYRDRIDWRRPVQCVLDRFRQSVTASGQEFRGFKIVPAPPAGPNGVAWEFTGQAVVAMRVVDRLYRGCRFEAEAASYVEQLRHAQEAAPFGDGRGLVGSTLQDGADLPPIEQCLSTPYQCIAERIGLAATTWAVFAERNVNPLAAAPPAPACTGDCRDDGAVTVDEVLAMVNIAPGGAAACTCPAGDADNDGAVSRGELLGALTKALGGCSS